MCPRVSDPSLGLAVTPGAWLCLSCNVPVVQCEYQLGGMTRRLYRGHSARIIQAILASVPLTMIPQPSTESNEYGTGERFTRWGRRSAAVGFLVVLYAHRKDFVSWNQRQSTQE